MKQPKYDPAKPELTNPGYKRSGPREVVVNGERCVSIEASSLWDYVQMRESLSRGRKRV